MKLTRERLKRIPTSSGVYTFTRRGAPLYVGKASNLRDRLAAYLPKRGWKEEMVLEATGLRVERTNSELEAFLLEAHRIAQHQPVYNLTQRHHTRFLSILVTTDEDFPKVLVTRSHRRAGTYFGPFTSAYAVRETLRALRKIFPYRCQQEPRGADDHRARPCLYFHMGQCAGTCAGRISKTAYRRSIIQPLLRIFRGEAMLIRKKLDAEHRALFDDVLAHTHVLSVTEKFASDVRHLMSVLGLPNLPRRIEGYDISTAHGIASTGAMVVATDGEPEPAEYKRFSIRGESKEANDIGMMTEVLERRIRHSESACQHLKIDCVLPWPDPDLILVDGGKAQRNAAMRVLKKAGLDIPIVALAKRAEEIYLPGERAPLRLSANSPALHLLQRIRDEAHRFAITYHRLKRGKRTFGRK
jgi:excinuclease ABC subunit C